MSAEYHTSPSLPWYSAPRCHTHPDTQPKILKLSEEIRRAGGRVVWEVAGNMLNDTPFSPTSGNTLPSFYNSFFTPVSLCRFTPLPSPVLSGSFLFPSRQRPSSQTPLSHGYDFINTATSNFTCRGLKITNTDDRLNRSRFWSNILRLGIIREGDELPSAFPS